MKKKCKWDGCPTILNRYHDGEYCYYHQDLIEAHEEQEKREVEIWKKMLEFCKVIKVLDE